MKRLYCGILGENVSDELVIPENVVDVRVVTKENGIFLQYVTDFDKKNKWATDIIERYSRSLKAFYFDRILRISFVELHDGKIGFSRCSMKDKFNVTIGKAVAICHALNKKIPDFI